MDDGKLLPSEPRTATNQAVTANPSEDRLESIVAMLLLELGLDISSQHFRDTPKRVAKFYREFTRGSRVKPAEILKTFRSCNRELIVVSGIEFFSLCPHHLLIYSGSVDFGYIPDGSIVGISKIPRLVQALAARPIVQEDLVADIAAAFMSEVKPLGCAVKITGKHDCVTARGVRCPEAKMTTVAMRGVFSEEQKYAAEFYQAIGR
jgi:GTP cyclohydrolase I